MAISWGSSEGTTSSSVQVGLEFIQSPSSVSNSTTSVDLTVNYYVRCTSGSWVDTQTVTGSGGNTASVTFTNDLSDGQYKRVGSYRRSNISLFYGSRASIEFGASLSGAYNGATPSHSARYNAPYRPAGKPGAPGRPSASNIDSNGARIDWAAAEPNGDSIIEYALQIDNNTNYYQPIVYVNSNDRTHTTNALSRAREYWCRVRARNSVGWGDWSSNRNFTTAPTVPDPPKAPSFVNTTSSSTGMTTSQNADGGRTIVEARWRYSKSSSMSGATTVYSGDWSGHTITGLDRDTRYYVQAGARNSVGWSGWSGTSSFTTRPTVPDRPATPTISGITSDSAAVGYGTLPNNGGSPFTLWEIQVATDSGFANIVRDLLDNTDPTTSFGVGFLDRATTHYVRTRAQNDVGWSAWSPSVSFKTLATEPDAPQSAPVLSNLLPTSIDVAYSAPASGGSAITGYEIQVSTSSNLSGATTVTDTASPLTLSDLTPGTRHYVRYRAKNAVGESAWSPSSSAETLSGMHIKVSGSWRIAKVWIKANGAWRYAKVWKKREGAWTL